MKDNFVFMYDLSYSIYYKRAVVVLRARKRFRKFFLNGSICTIRLSVRKREIHICANRKVWFEQIL